MAELKGWLLIRTNLMRNAWSRSFYPFNFDQVRLHWPVKTNHHPLGLFGRVRWLQIISRSKKNADSRSTDRLHDWNGHKSNKQKNIINQWPADHQAKGCMHPLDAEAGGKHSMSKEKKTCKLNKGSHKWPHKTSSDTDLTTKFERIPNNI